MPSPLTEMSVYKAREMFVMGWSVNGMWLVLDHDQDRRLFRVELHSHAGWEWGTQLQYTEPHEEDGTRMTLLRIGADRGLVSAMVCAQHKSTRPSAIVYARLRYRVAPLSAAAVCRNRPEFGRDPTTSLNSADTLTGCGVVQ